MIAGIALPDTIPTILRAHRVRIVWLEGMASKSCSTCAPGLFSNFAAAVLWERCRLGPPSAKDARWAFTFITAAVQHAFAVQRVHTLLNLGVPHCPALQK